MKSDCGKCEQSYSRRTNWDGISVTEHQTLCIDKKRYISIRNRERQYLRREMYVEVSLLVLTRIASMSYAHSA